MKKKQSDPLNKCYNMLKKSQSVKKNSTTAEKCCKLLEKV